ncbi:hypothetical protein ACFX13_026813 [Malus domestica]
MASAILRASACLVPSDTTTHMFFSTASSAGDNVHHFASKPSRQFFAVNLVANLEISRESIQLTCFWNLVETCKLFKHFENDSPSFLPNLETQNLFA